MSIGSAAWLAGAGWPGRADAVITRLRCGAWPAGNGSRAVQQRLAAQPGGDVGGLAGRGSGGLVIAEVAEMGGVVEQAVGQVVAGGVLAQPADRGGERRARVRVRVGAGGRQAGAGQVAFGALHGGQLPRPVALEQGQQVAGGGGVSQVVRGASGERPGPTAGPRR